MKAFTFHIKPASLPPLCSFTCSMGTRRTRKVKEKKRKYTKNLVGVLRACVQQTPSQMADGTRVYVHNLPWSITEDLLHEHMAAVRFIAAASRRGSAPLPHGTLTQAHRTPTRRPALWRTCR